MSRVIERASGAQVLPDIDDERQVASSWAVHLCCDADQRTKHEVYRDLAAVMVVKAGGAK